MRLFPYTTVFLLFFSVSQTFAQSLPKDCSSESQSTLRERAMSGDRRAQYLMGYQLSVGQCGIKDPRAGLELLAKSAAQHYSPSLQLLGVIYRREGNIKDAVGYFFAAAQHGFHLAEVDLAYAYSEQGSPIQNDAAAFAWFSLALAHEDKSGGEEILHTELKKVTSRMSDMEKAKAEQLKNRLLILFGSVPRFNDDP
jgi:TPR repeat protein